MASQIAYKGNEIPTNNMQFSRLIDFVIEIGRETAKNPEEIGHVERMIQLRDTEFWPGRGIQIEEDFPHLGEQKFWARVFLDAARAIFDRRLGVHEHCFWQAQCIHQSYGSGQLFVQAVRDHERSWMPDSTDYQEFEIVVNNRRQ